jgi:hypothetical protein
MLWQSLSVVLLLLIVWHGVSYRVGHIPLRLRWSTGGIQLHRGLKTLNGEAEPRANRDRETYDDVTDNDRAQTGRGGADVDNVQAEMGESLLDQSIQDAVNNLIKKVEYQSKFEEDGRVKMTPEEKFQEIYRRLKEESSKAKENDGDEVISIAGGSLEQQQERAAIMLDQLFGGEQAKDPFDERAVMMKLKNMLHIEDFKELFIDPKIGDYL